MAAGFSGILGVQGVIPVSSPSVVAAAEAGLRDILALQGVMPVQSVPTAPAATGGFVSMLQTQGVWVNSANLAEIEPPVEIEEPHTHDRFREGLHQQLMREDEELIILARAFIEIIQCQRN